MSKIFRNVRKNLLEEGALKKYFNYALGEIILMIISILFALQINNWNQNRVDRNEAGALIGNLYDEFEQNKTNLESKVTELKTSIKTAHILIELIGKSKAELQQYNLDSLMSRSFQYKKFNPSEDVLMVLVQSGKLSLVKNDSIRDLVYDWSSDKISVHENFEDLDDNMSKILDYLTLNYSLKDFDKYSSDSKTKGSNLPVNKYKIFEQLPFENHVQNHIYYLSTYTKSLEKTGKLIDDITAISEKYQ